jgi:hypothetical protein
MAAVCHQWQVTFVEVTRALAEDSTWIAESLAGTASSGSGRVRQDGRARPVRRLATVADGTQSGGLSAGGPAPAGADLRSPCPDDHLRVLSVADEWWGGFGGEAGSLQRALLLPALFSQHFAGSGPSLTRGPPTSTSSASIRLLRHGVAAALYRRFFELARSSGRRPVHAIITPRSAPTGTVPGCNRRDRGSPVGGYAGARCDSTICRS